LHTHWQFGRVESATGTPRPLQSAAVQRGWQFSVGPGGE
jgi:hypothetical protein